MRRAYIVYNKERQLHRVVSQGLQEVLADRGWQVSFGASFFEEGSSEEIDLLISLDLMGFERITETGNYSYNLQTFKMCHILFGDKEEYSTILKSDLSIAMFFCCIGSVAEENRIREKYPQLPWLFGVPDTSVQSLGRAVDLVREQGFFDLSEMTEER